MNNYENKTNLSEELIKRADVYLNANFEDPDKRCDSVRFSVCSETRWSLSSAASRSESVYSLAFDQRQRLRSSLAAKPETFSQALIRLIREAGITHSECYQKALVSKQLFSKIQSDVDYRPSRETVFAFAIALSLSLDQAVSLLKKAGFAFSNSRKTDVIVKFAITEGIHDVMRVNELLDHYHEKPLL